MAEHSMTQDELTAQFREEGFKELPNKEYRRYGFTQTKVKIDTKPRVTSIA